MHDALSGRLSARQFLSQVWNLKMDRVFTWALLEIDPGLGPVVFQCSLPVGRVAQWAQFGRLGCDGRVGHTDCLWQTWHGCREAAHT